MPTMEHMSMLMFFVISFLFHSFFFHSFFFHSFFSTSFDDLFLMDDLFFDLFSVDTACSTCPCHSSLPAVAFGRAVEHQRQMIGPSPWFGRVQIQTAEITMTAAAHQRSQQREGRVHLSFLQTPLRLRLPLLLLILEPKKRVSAFCT